MIADPLPYGVFDVVVVGLLSVDLLVVHRHAHEVTVRESSSACAL